MDSSVPAAAPVPALALALAPVLPQAPQALPGLLSPSPLASRQHVGGSERGACLWRPWLSSTNDPPTEVRKFINSATGGATGAKVTKANSEFHHPVRFFWPKSHSFDYLYSDGEILLQNFPVQATINLYEDSNSEEEEEEEKEEEEEGEKDKEEEKKEKADEKGLEECVRAPHITTAHPPSPLLMCPN